MKGHIKSGQIEISGACEIKELIKRLKAHLASQNGHGLTFRFVGIKGILMGFNVSMIDNDGLRLTNFYRNACREKKLTLDYETAGMKQLHQLP